LLVRDLCIARVPDRLGVGQLIEMMKLDRRLENRAMFLAGTSTATSRPAGFDTLADCHVRIRPIALGQKALSVSVCVHLWLK
jgi:hypothetical protein